MEPLTPDEIVRLSPPERIALIAQLWDSLDDGGTVGMTAKPVGWVAVSDRQLRF
jgi:hypothetical protein